MMFGMHVGLILKSAQQGESLSVASGGTRKRSRMGSISLASGPSGWMRRTAGTRRRMWLRLRLLAQERMLFAGTLWTEELRMFLLVLRKLCKGDWRRIAKNYMTTRTPTQVASHAQKYFVSQSN